MSYDYDPRAKHTTSSDYDAWTKRIADEDEEGVYYDEARMSQARQGALDRIARGYTENQRGMIALASVLFYAVEVWRSKQ